MASFWVASLDQPWGFPCTFLRRGEGRFVAPSLTGARLSHHWSRGGESQLPHWGSGSTPSPALGQFLLQAPSWFGAYSFLLL